MRDQSFNQITSDAQSLAKRVGAETTEALIRAVSGVQQATGEGLAAARQGVGAAGEQIGHMGHGIAEGMQTLATPNTSARLAWRSGRIVGRIEGAVRLASFGVRFWWGRRRSRGQENAGTEWTHMIVQWGPTAVASVCLAIQISQLWGRLRRRATAAPA